MREPLPLPVVRALTLSSVRTELTEAVSRGDAVRRGGIDESWQFLTGLFDLAKGVSTGIVIEAAPQGDLRLWLVERAADTDCLREWIQFCEVEREMARMGLTKVLTEVMSGRVKPEEAGPAFRARFLRLWLDAVYERVPALRQFATDAHERLTEQFRDLDRPSQFYAPTPACWRSSRRDYLTRAFLHRRTRTSSAPLALTYPSASPSDRRAIRPSAPAY